VQKMTKFVAYTGREELANLKFEWNLSEFEEKIKTGTVDEFKQLEDVNVGETKWVFKVFPNGRTATGKDGVDFLVFSHNKAPVTAKVSVSVMKHTENSTSVFRQRLLNRTFQALTNLCDGAGWHNLLSHKRIKGDASLLSNGNLHLVIKLTVLGEEKTTRKPINNDQEIGSIEIQERLRVTEHLKDSWTNDNFSDVHIKCGGQIFYCHRMILSKRSQYFSSMLESGMKESEIRVIDLKYMDVGILKAILKFIYGGEIDNLEKNAVDLLKAAGMFILEDLKTVCEKYLLANYMKVDNVIDVLVMAETHNAVSLKKAAIEMIVDNKDDIVKQVGWKDKLANSSKLLLIEIVEAMAVNKGP